MASFAEWKFTTATFQEEQIRLNYTNIFIHLFARTIKPLESPNNVLELKRRYSVLYRYQINKRFYQSLVCRSCPLSTPKLLLFLQSECRFCMDIVGALNNRYASDSLIEPAHSSVGV